jgi:hypothetical protein
MVAESREGVAHWLTFPVSIIIRFCGVHPDMAGVVN